MYITVPSVYTKLTRTKLMTTASVHVAQLVIERCSGDPEVAGSIPSRRGLEVDFFTTSLS